jgi:TRAP-type C4-dicarboxylate transport system permease small subunit
MQADTSSNQLRSSDGACRRYFSAAVRMIWRWGTEAVVIALMAIMVSTIVLQVVFRFVIGDPLAWSEELARYVLVWITFLGAAVAYRQGAHIVVEAVVGLLPRHTRLVLAWTAEALTTVALIGLLVYGLQITEVTSTVHATMLGMPMSWVYAAVPASATIMLLYQVERIVHRIRGTWTATTPPSTK